tara:strand:+ start:3002 stop:3250 length:249 start_codon:yes stop_codon:yes gene_type:complete
MIDYILEQIVLYPILFQIIIMPIVSILILVIIELIQRFIPSEKGRTILISALELFESSVRNRGYDKIKHRYQTGGKPKGDKK